MPVKKESRRSSGSRRSQNRNRDEKSRQRAYRTRNSNNNDRANPESREERQRTRKKATSSAKKQPSKQIGKQTVAATDVEDRKSTETESLRRRPDDKRKPLRKRRQRKTAVKPTEQYANEGIKANEESPKSSNETSEQELKNEVKNVNPIISEPSNEKNQGESKPKEGIKKPRKRGPRPVSTGQLKSDSTTENSAPSELKQMDIKPPLSDASKIEANHNFEDQSDASSKKARDMSPRAINDPRNIQKPSDGSVGQPDSKKLKAAEARVNVKPEEKPVAKRRATNDPRNKKKSVTNSKPAVTIDETET